MPKKLQTNQKAQESRDREKEKKKQEKTEKEERAEAQKWKETDSKILKQLDKQKEQEQKRLQELQKREEKKRLQEEDEKKMAPRGEGKKDKIVKKTFSEIKRIQQENLMRTLEKQAKEEVGAHNDEEEEEEKKETDYHTEKDNNKNSNNDDEGEDLSDFTKNLEENLMQLLQQHEASENGKQFSGKVVSASGVSEALQQLDDEKGLKHPEKKVKAAYMRYVDEQLPIIKQENPSLKRTQLL